MKRTQWGLAGLLFLLAPPAHAQLAVPRAQQQCFQAQFLMRQPQLEALAFIEAVKSLRDINADDEAATQLRISALSVQAAALRHDEGRAFSRLTPLLKTMGGPADLQAWAAAEADGLSRPLKFTPDEAKQARTDPETAAILATLDEADALKTDTNRHLYPFDLWFHLTQGRVGLWAADVGDMAALLQAALAAHKAPGVSVKAARALRDAAPAGTPPSVRDALGLLAPQAGNLAELAPAAHNDVPLTTVAQAHDALLAAFDPRHLLADDTPPASPKP